MPRISNILPTPGDWETLIAYLKELGAASERLEFGDPSDPFDPQSSTLAGVASTNHPGTLVNIAGAWVEVEVSALDTAVTCYHNLDVPVVSASQPNVRWLPFMAQHDGGQGTWWDDLRSPGSTGKPGPTSFPTYTTMSVAPFDTLALNWFQPGTDEELYFQVQLPHGWKEGSDIEAHVHWTPEISAGANECVQWGLEYSWANRGASFPASTTIYSDATDDTTATNQGVTVVASDHYVSQINKTSVGGAATISGTGKTISSMIACRLFRDTASAGPGTDDYVDEAGLLELDFHIQRDSVGADTQSSKTSGYGLDAQTWSVRYDPTDTVAANSIQLRFNAHPSLLVDGSNKLKATLFFTRAIR